MRLNNIIVSIRADQLALDTETITSFADKRGHKSTFLVSAQEKHRAEDAYPTSEHSLKPGVRSLVRKAFHKFVSDAIIQQDDICLVEQKEQIRGNALIEMDTRTDLHRKCV